MSGLLSAAQIAAVLAASAAAQGPFAGAGDADLAGDLERARESPTAEAWAAAHPSDVREEFVAPEAGDHDTGRWCLRFTGAGQLASGKLPRRTAYFFDPPPPAGLALPAGAPEGLAMGCRLGLLWVEADGSARPALARAAAAALGRGRASGDAVGFASARWAEAEEWSVPDQVHAVVAGREDGAFLRYSLPAWDRWRPAPGEVERRAREERRRVVAELAAAVRGVAGIDQGARQAMLALLDRSPDPDAPRPVPNAVAALQAWTAALARLEPGQRASALLAADGVAAAADLPQPEPRGGSAPEGVVRVGGAEMAYGELGGGWSYAHNFLREALAIAPPGPIRDRAVLREMEIAFDYTGTCSAGEEVFDRIIAAGEALLARSRDREVLSQAGFMVADAHATVVALARGAGGEYADPARYARREPEARRKAIAAYRAALALDHLSERARAAWSTAWRLLAGLSPEAPRYFCIYD